MAAISVVAHALAIGPRVLSHVLTVGTAVSVVATTVTLAVVITVVMKNDPGSDNPLTYQTVILKSQSKLAFNRDISSYELDYYYNATETLLTVVDQLDNQLKESFPNYYTKIVLSEFSPKPETNFTEVRKRQYNEREYPDEKTSRTSDSSTRSTTQTSSVTTTIESSSSSTDSMTTENLEYVPSSSTLITITSDSIEITADLEPSSVTSPQTTTLYSYSTSSTTTTSSMFSAVSTLFPTLTTTTFEPVLTTTVTTTPLQTNYVSNCTISKFNNTTKRPSLVYVYGTLYFNVTKTSDITVQNIIDALKNVFPPIKLMDVCGNPSSANGYFNITESYISPLTQTNPTEADLNATNSIPSDLLNQIDAVTPPPITPKPMSILTALSTVTTNSTLLVTTVATNLTPLVTPETTTQTSSIVASIQTDSTSLIPETSTQTYSTTTVETRTDSTSTTTVETTTTTDSTSTTGIETTTTTDFASTNTVETTATTTQPESTFTTELSTVALA